MIYLHKNFGGFHLCNYILWNINKEYITEGLIKKKSKLFSFLYKKKPKKEEISNANIASEENVEQNVENNGVQNEETNS